MLIKIIIVALLAIATGVITYLLDKRNMGVGFLGGLGMVVICLILLSPAGDTNEYYGCTDLFSHQLAAILPCDHIHDRSDLDNNKYIRTTTYSYVYQTLFMGDDQVTILEFCPECYTMKESKKYFKDHKNDDSAFVNKVSW